jgi:hypothetical protein
MPRHDRRPPHRPPRAARPHGGGLRGGRARRGPAHRGRVRAQGHLPLRGGGGPGLHRALLPRGRRARGDRGLGVRRGAVLCRAAGGRSDAALHAHPGRGGHLLPRGEPGSQALHRPDPRRDAGRGARHRAGRGAAPRRAGRRPRQRAVRGHRLRRSAPVARRGPHPGPGREGGLERGDPAGARALLAHGVLRAPFGAHPFSSPGFYLEDRGHIGELVEAGRAFARTGDRGPFERYLDRYVHGPADHVEYLEAVGLRRLLALGEY